MRVQSLGQEDPLNIPLQCSCLENPMDRRAWRAIGHRVTRSETQMKWLSMHACVKVKVAQSCPTGRPHGLYSPWNSPDQNTGMGSISLFQGIFLAQGSNPGLPHCRWILYQLSHKGSLRILEWVAYPFSSGSSHLRNQTGVSRIAGGFLTNWTISEAHVHRVYFK